MDNNCPQHCRGDRENLRNEIKELKDDRQKKWEKADCQFKGTVSATTMKWVIGIILVIACSALGVVYKGQMHNADMIIQANKQFLQDLGQVSKEITELKIIVTRIDERTKSTQKKLDGHPHSNNES